MSENNLEENFKKWLQEVQQLLDAHKDGIAEDELRRKMEEFLGDEARKLNEQISAAKQENENLEKQTRSKIKIDTLIKRLQAIETKDKEWSRFLAQYMQDIADIQKKIKEAKDELAKAREELEQKWGPDIKDYDDLRQRLAALQQKEQQIGDLEKLTDNIEKLNNKLTEKQKEKADLENQIAMKRMETAHPFREYQNKIEEVERKNADTWAKTAETLQNNANAFQTALNNLTQQMQSCIPNLTQEVNKSLSEQIKALQKHHAQIINAVCSGDEALAAANEKYQKLWKDYQQLEEEKNKTEQDNRKFQRQEDRLKEEQDEVKQLSQEAEKYKPGHVERLEREADRAKKNAEKYWNEIQSMSAAKEEIDALKNSYANKHPGEFLTIAQIGEKLNTLQEWEELAELAHTTPAAVSDNLKNLKKDKLELEQKLAAKEAEVLAQTGDLAAKEKEKELLIAKHQSEMDELLSHYTLDAEVARVRETMTKAFRTELDAIKKQLEGYAGDPCPGLSKWDAYSIKNDSECQRRDGRDPAPADLKKLVDYIRSYAYHKMGGMIYKEDDIRAFLSGMAVSHLLILQGMSGTGKTKLPEVVAAAIAGRNPCIPVESSWRDKNELLGYYNEFHKRFNAKEFTQEVYKSGLEGWKDFPTLITLDEMNLARVEYYFADFLSVMEKPLSTEGPYWLISLHDDKISWQTAEKNLCGPANLKDGHLLKVPTNIWFVGTINNDESTMEISDKVYDRAQVISLNERVESAHTIPAPEKEFCLNHSELSTLLEQARADCQTAETFVDDTKLNALDEHLKREFGISIGGNRMVRQARQFTNVFVSAGGDQKVALDYQISTKILRKLSTCYNRTKLEELQKIEELQNLPLSQKVLEGFIKKL